jgi:hypothetical protein
LETRKKRDAEDDQTRHAQREQRDEPAWPIRQLHGVNTSRHEDASKEGVDAIHGFLTAVDAGSPSRIPGVSDDE